MNDQFTVIFERCGPAAAGDVVRGADVASDVASLEYLVRVGAIVPVEGKSSEAPDGAAPLSFGQRMAAARAAKAAKLAEGS